ncbi:shock factor protein 4 [Seminavis robusta]|uniref:Shock factor protein 4 n=1 Tax=Seminavis robusta TaxID=568900 RepID=A0A9N8DM33_9STRA|nr:shock factor protein 4 [Seminavis robusta]|eukprot:Sro233_g094210.1 shock factor protein 4 (250) ;mRNA; f:43815-44564
MHPYFLQGRVMMGGGGVRAVGVPVPLMPAPPVPATASTGTGTAAAPGPQPAVFLASQAQAMGWPSSDETRLLLNLQFQQQHQQQHQQHFLPGAPMAMPAHAMPMGQNGKWNTAVAAPKDNPFAGLGNFSKIEPFPERLHRLLQEVEAQGQSHIISWVNNGEAFEIHQSDRFFAEIVPRYFKQSRLSSFKRQLGLYGFQLCAPSHQVTRGGTGHGYYSHPCFRRDSPELCRRMRRTGLSKAKKGAQDSAK